MITQLVLPRAKWKAFTLCWPFLDISQGEQDRFFFLIFFFHFTMPCRLECGQCRVNKIWTNI